MKWPSIEHCFYQATPCQEHKDLLYFLNLLPIKMTIKRQQLALFKLLIRDQDLGKLGVQTKFGLTLFFQISYPQNRSRQ